MQKILFEERNIKTCFSLYIIEFRLKTNVIVEIVSILTGTNENALHVILLK